jgi:hypothetical protein
MESFKAANPQCLIEDFVHWYSPKDYIDPVSPDTAGKLSQRMIEPDNIWQQCWLNSKPIPANLQKPLFEIESEYHKALHYLETIDARSIITQLLPTFLLVIYDTLTKSSVAAYTIPSVQRTIKELQSHILEIEWNRIEKMDGEDFLDIFDILNRAETCIAIAMSLLKKVD